VTDHSEICSVVAGLALAYDRRDAALYPTFWEDEAELRYADEAGRSLELIGKPAILDFVAKLWAGAEPTPLHVVTSPHVDLKWDHAVVRYYTVHVMPSPVSRPVGVGEYLVVVRKGGDGKWRIRSQQEIQRIPYDK
jgi:hypothetical protein